MKKILERILFVIKICVGWIFYVPCLIVKIFYAMLKKDWVGMKESFLHILCFPLLFVAWFLFASSLLIEDWIFKRKRN